MIRFASANLPVLKKTASYYVMHIVVTAAVAYAVTGNLLMAFTLSLLEPTVQAVAFFFHEKAWERRLHHRSVAISTSAPNSLASLPTR